MKKPGIGMMNISAVIIVLSWIPGGKRKPAGIMISNLAGISKGKPSYATLPLPGIIPLLVDEKGRPVPGSMREKMEYFMQDAKGDTIAGNLCIRFPWPSIIRTTYGDHERCRLNYFATYPEFIFHR